MAVLAAGRLALFDPVVDLAEAALADRLEVGAVGDFEELSRGVATGLPAHRRQFVVFQRQESAHVAG